MGSWFNMMFLASRTAIRWGQDEDRRRAHDAGFDHHMVKPVDVQTLLEVLAGRGCSTSAAQRLGTPLWQRHQSGHGAKEAAALNDVDTQRVNATWRAAASRHQEAWVR